MKKLLVLALAAVLVLGFAAMTMAEATFSGEIDTGYKAQSPDQGDSTSEPFIFGKVVMSGKLGDDLTGTMVIRSNTDPNCFTDPSNPDENLTNNFNFDEADVLFTESWGTLKFGYFGWNNNPKDIVDTLRGDVKSHTTMAASFKLAENFNLGLAYAYQPSDAKGETDGANSPKYGVDFGYAGDVFGADLMYTTDSSFFDKSGDRIGVIGVQGYAKLGDFKPYVQFEEAGDDVYTATGKLKDTPMNEIIGFTYDSADVPVYVRIESDLATENDKDAQVGVRLGYKFTDGAKLEAQHFSNAISNTYDYLKLICAF